MAWIKRNLIFVIGATVALVLLGVAGWYTFSGWQHNAEEREKLNKAYEDLKRLNNLNPHPGRGAVDNIKEARTQTQQVRTTFVSAVGRFAPIAPIPAWHGPTNPPTSQEFASALRQTVDQLQREATNSSVVLPLKYKFSFEVQSSRYVFAEGSLAPLSVQLGEVKAICDILNQAKINSLESLRRSRVSTDDQAGTATDYLDTHSETNELAILTPYEVTFKSFSPELAAVMAGFANSPNGIVVKAVNVEPAAILVPDPTQVTPAAVQPVYMPQPLPTPGLADRERARDSAFAERYGLRGMRGGKDGPGSVFPTPAPVPVQPVMVAQAPKSSALKTVLDERQLKVTLMLQIVKMLPPK